MFAKNPFLIRQDYAENCADFVIFMLSLLVCLMVLLSVIAWLRKRHGWGIVSLVMVLKCGFL